MSRIRVLVVDDSVVIRKLVSDALATDPDVVVAGTAANGKIALAKLEQLGVDVVTLDVEMPEMDGLETLAEIRKRFPKLPVIMFSTLTERGADITLQALALGASDYVAKPTASGGLGPSNAEDAKRKVASELLPKVKVLTGSRSSLSTPPRPISAEPPALRPFNAATASGRIDILAIGASTGGPNALAVLLANVAKPVSVPIVIVQHMPPLFTRLLAQRLTASCGLPVHEAQHGDVLQAGEAWIAPGGKHMVVALRGGKLVAELNEDPPENSCRPAVDVLFRSVADLFGSRTLAVILTGMGQDGLRGCERIDREGGQIVAQDEASSVVWGMPGYVVRAGIADAVAPVDTLHVELGRRLQRQTRGVHGADQR